MEFATINNKEKIEKSKEDLEEFRKAVTPLMEWLEYNKVNPHLKVIVTATDAHMVEDISFVKREWTTP